jgi:hypothetical protein
MKPTKLYEVTLDDFGTYDYEEEFSNVIIIGFDTCGKLAVVDCLDESTLDRLQKIYLASKFEDIVDRLNIVPTIYKAPKTSCPYQGLVGTNASDNPYKKTVEGMLSADYKERFKAEYKQLKIRVEKLNDFCNKIEAARGPAEHRDAVEEPKHDCSFELLTHQLMVMREYLHDLEIRAVIEKIDLT